MIKVVIFMCLILFAYQQHPQYPLIVAANRDEFYERKTKEAHFWDDHPLILAGRDLEKLGTWLGVTKTGRFAAVTNYRNPQELVHGKKSRGNLVVDALTYRGHLSKYMEHIHKEKDSFPGFNLLFGDIHQLYYYSNIEGKGKRLTKGIYGLSNHLLNTPWPKVKKGTSHLKKFIEEPSQLSIESLFSILTDEERAKDEDLPNTGVPIEMERMLSPLFIKSKDYGTRSSTVLFLSETTVTFVERVYMNGKVKEQQFNFHIQQTIR